MVGAGIGAAPLKGALAAACTGAAGVGGLFPNTKGAAAGVVEAATGCVPTGVEAENVKPELGVALASAVELAPNAGGAGVPDGVLDAFVAGVAPNVIGTAAAVEGVSADFFASSMAAGGAPPKRKPVPGVLAAVGVAAEGPPNVKPPVAVAPAPTAGVPVPKENLEGSGVAPVGTGKSEVAPPKENWEPDAADGVFPQGICVAVAAAVDDPEAGAGAADPVDALGASHAGHFTKALSFIIRQT